MPKRKHPTNYRLEPGEKEIVAAFEQGRIKPYPDSKKRIAALEAIAANHIRKDSRITIRLSSGDLKALKHIALEEGLPYQTLIASVLHKFISRRLAS